MGKSKKKPLAPEASGVAVDPQPAQTVARSKQTSASPPAVEWPPAWATVGETFEVAADYLEMKDVKDESGLRHCGYLVLRRSETVRILYIGSEQTGDVGWLYGEVGRSKPPEPAGRRGWLPAHPLKPLPPPSPAAAALALPRAAAERVAVAAVAGAAASGGAARGGGAKASGSKAWAQEEATSSPCSAQAAAIIARNRALAQAAAAQAAKAATAAAAKGRGVAIGTEQCPICAEAFRGRYARTSRPCCSVPLCVQCDHKSLRSGKCYFCRGESEEFPDIVVACRVAAVA